MTHYSYITTHLGDNLVHLHFLRHMALKYPQHEFVHAAKKNYLHQLQETIDDMSNVKLIPVTDDPDFGWMNAWKNFGKSTEPNGFDQFGFWDKHPLKNDFSNFYLDLFEKLASDMDLESPFRKPDDLWFDYPKIKSSNYSSAPEFDFLVVNSIPLSGQFRAFNDAQYLTPLIEELAEKYRVVVTSPLERRRDGAAIPCTLDHRMTVTDIGAMSLRCPYLLMVATGPMWPTFNVWNRESVKLRLILLDTEQLNLGGNTVQVTSCEAARSVLVSRGLI